MTTTTKRAVRKTNKIKKSFTLSKTSVSFLRQAKRESHVRSESEMLDRLLQEARQRQQMEACKQATTAYYDSLTDEETKRDAVWGEFGLRGLAANNL